MHAELDLRNVALQSQRRYHTEHGLSLFDCCETALMCVTSAGYDPIPPLRVGLDGDPGYFFCLAVVG